MAAPPAELREAYARCEALARARQENFPVLSEYISPEHSHHLAAVYAFCRIADDAADESKNSAEALSKLAFLEGEVHRVFSNERPTSPEFVALQNTARERKLTIEPFLQLLDAFRQDQTKTRYHHWEELLDYSKRSANPVGALVLSTVGELPGVDPAADREKLRLSNLICTGLQLANFWQDAARDYKKGRIYIPADAMTRRGVREEDFANGNINDSFRRMMAELCDRTEPMFAEGCALADLVSKRLKIPILAFSIAGSELLNRIRAANYDILNKRPEIGDLPLKKILAKAAAASFLPALRPKVKK